MSDEMVKYEEATIVRLHPSEVIKQATEEADVLKEVIESRHLFSVINGKRFVKVEGWTTLATLRGCLPREIMVVEMPEGRYVAEVELVRISDGLVLTKASAECGGPEDPTWQKRPPNARRSMAITRATGKACRVAFSWVMTLAGYEPTPEEEMPQHIESDVVIDVTRKAKERESKPVTVPDAPEGTLRFIGTVDDYSVKDGKHASGTAWTKLGIRMVNTEGEKSNWLSTFDTGLMEIAKRLKDGGDICEAWYIDDGKFKTLVDISPVVFE